ncbi:hypothetical protein, partial [Aestuariivirga sp.]|uniref:hypothetical protein n=1 Tax=Aestuariivirga sp. TaxID=2650926 RepID=UPI0035AE2832
MPRDEMRRPLKRLTFAQRLWRRRPSPLVAAALAIVTGFGAGSAWLSRIPAPLAGEPVVMAAIPENAELVTSSTTPAEAAAPPPADDSGALPEVPIDPN